MALLIVPDDHLTIQGAINASVSGGDIGVRPGDYNEALTDNGLDGIHLFGLGGVPRVHWGAGAAVITIASNHGWIIENLEVDAEDGAARCIYFSASNQSRALRCICHNSTVYNIHFLNSRASAINCASYAAGQHGYYSTNDDGLCVQCTAQGNTLGGFQGGAASQISVQGCLASGNGTDFVNARATYSSRNVSGDGTAPGTNVRIGFNPANLINIWQLAFGGENGANIAGWPLSREDILENLRSRETLEFYAGCHDPDPFDPCPSVTPPICFGMIDAAQAAQGCIHVRWFEACILEGELYRYDFHVKRLDNGPLTPAEIDDHTYYARSLYADEITGCMDSGSPAHMGSPMGDPGILQALIAFEAPNDITGEVVPRDENMHLFTNREYHVAVRAVAIDGNLIAEDDNTQVVTSWSSGYQGVLWHHILSWPCLELCKAILQIGIHGIPTVNVGTLPKLTLDVENVPPLVVDVPEQNR